MGDTVDKRVLTDALKTFAGYLDDLGRTRFDDASTKMRLVINYAQRDDVARSLAGLFRSRISRERFLDHVLVEHGLTPPEAPLDHLAFCYDLILHLKMGWKLNLREVLSRAELAGGDMDARWKRFQQRFVGPLEQGVLAIRAEIERGGAERLDPDAAVRTAAEALYGASAAPAPAPAKTAPAPAATAAQAPAQAPAVGLPPRLEPLAAQLEAAGLDAGLRGDLQVDLELLALELGKQTPTPARLAELVEGFAAAGLEEAARACVGEDLVAAGDDGSTEAAREALANQRAALAAEREALSAERASLSAERASLTAERQALDAERKALTASQRAAE